MIRQILDNADGAFDALGKSEKARQRTLFEGGLKIITTLDPQWQSYAQQAADAAVRDRACRTNGSAPSRHLDRVGRHRRNGAIRTMLSGKNFHEDKLDLATTAHPPGSSFKPFVLAAAFEQGMPPTQTYSSTSPFCSPLWQDADHCVFNAEGGSAGGKVDLWTATQDSINVVFAQLILDIGPETVPPVATKMGITTDLPPVASLATGSAEVSPLDMAVGYATLANGGVHCTPYTVQTIQRDGKELYEHEPNCERALRPDIAHLITAMLEAGAEVRHRGERLLRGWGPGRSPARPGTANLNTNVWFCGYTRQVATAVWVGSNGKPYSLGSVFGGTVAAPIWRCVHVPRDVGPAGGVVPGCADDRERDGARRRGSRRRRRDRGAPGGRLPCHGRGRGLHPTGRHRRRPGSQRRRRGRPGYRDPLGRQHGQGTRRRGPVGGGASSGRGTGRPGRRRLRGARPHREGRPHARRHRAVASA